MTMPLPMTSAALALGASPDIESAFHAVWEALGRQHHLPAAILELARLRLAAMHRADREMALRSPWASGLSEPKAALVLTGSWHRAADFAASEKAVLAFAEIYVQGAEFITDELAADIASRRASQSVPINRIQKAGAAITQWLAFTAAPSSFTRILVKE